ncbi:MAG TPA: MaoC family dehydratase [Nocardioides sp.]|nr:MaoC family dehydratase [Nocardioides sp.]
MRRHTVKVYDGLAAFAQAEGDVLGTSDWMVVEQDRIDRFAEATGDHQWIHVDPERAKDGPFGATIAHGFLTLSLLPPLLNSLYRVDDVAMAVNYGLDKVRFMAPVRVDSKIRATAKVLTVTPMEGAVQAVFETTFEIEGSEKPAAVVQSIVRYFG